MRRKSDNSVATVDISPQKDGDGVTPVGPVSLDMIGPKCFASPANGIIVRCLVSFLEVAQYDSIASHIIEYGTYLSGYSRASSNRWSRPCGR